MQSEGAASLGWDVSHSPGVCCGQQVPFVSAVHTPDLTTQVSVQRCFTSFQHILVEKQVNFETLRIGVFPAETREVWRWNFCLVLQKHGADKLQHAAAVSWKSIAYEKGRAGCEELEAGNWRFGMSRLVISLNRCSEFRRASVPSLGFILLPCHPYVWSINYNDWFWPILTFARIRSLEVMACFGPYSHLFKNSMQDVSREALHGLAAWGLMRS